MTYRIELIPKTSTLDDIIEPWVCSGRIDNRAEGEFVFDGALACDVRSRTIVIEMPNGKTYYYNMEDFYRVKVIDTAQPELFE